MPLIYIFLISLKLCWENATIYDQNDIVIARVIDSNSQTIAYSSFEKNEKESWLFDGSPITDSIGGCKTGHYYYHLSNGAIESPLLQSGEYKLSFWAADSNVIVTGVNMEISQKCIRKIKQYILYEVLLKTDGGTKAKITGRTKIDELRIHARHAKMSTMTYDIRFGRQSLTDPDNRTIYYETINGELINIWDENGGKVLPDFPNKHYDSDILQKGI